MTALKFKTPIQIRFKDLDMLGHVNSSLHYTYFELARVNYFDELGKGIKIDWASSSLVVAKTEMEYIHQIMKRDKLFVSVWVTRIGTKSFDMSCSIVKEVGGKEIEVAKGSAIIVCFDFKTQKSVAVPEAWKPIMLGTD